MKKVSIITVVLNDAHGIEATIENIKQLEGNDYEYIIIDGKSNDGSLDVVIKSEEYFVNKGINYIFVSEKDNGVYDAMNKAINYAHGEYVIYMNAGDSFVNQNVLEKVSEYLDGKNDVVYGDTIIDKGQWERMQISEECDILVERIPFCHQSVFTRTDLVKEYMFDLKYKICADYNMFLKMYLDGRILKRVDVVISRFLCGGISFSDFGRDLNLESIDVRYDNELINALVRKKEIRNVNRRYSVDRLKTLIKKICPDFILNSFMESRYKKKGWILKEKCENNKRL